MLAGASGGGSSLWALGYGGSRTLPPRRPVPGADDKAAVGLMLLGITGVH
jgi:hypothetical protein